MGGLHEHNLKEKIKRYIEEQITNDQFSGVVLIVKDEKPIVQQAVGFANKKKRNHNTLNTIFNVGSMNKMFTGIGIAQLVQQNLVSFDDTISKYLPDYPNQSFVKETTIHQLLTHTSGLGHYLADKPKFLTAREKLKSINDFIDFFKNDPIPFKSGEYNYSGNGYELLGAIIEKISGQNYYDYVKENIFQIAHMPNTDSYEIDQNNLPTNIAIGYTRRGDDGEPRLEGERRENFFILLPKGGAGGGGYSTYQDLLNFSQALLQNKLLSPEMTQLVLTPKIKIGTKNNQTLYYGYGFQILDVGDGNYRLGHAGSFAGANARLDMYPWLGYTVVVLSNYDEPSAFRIANEAGDLII